METQWEVPFSNYCWEKNTVYKIAPGSAPPKRIQNDDEVLRARSETKVEENMCTTRWVCFRCHLHPL